MDFIVRKDEVLPSGILGEVLQQVEGGDPASLLSTGEARLEVCWSLFQPQPFSDFEWFCEAAEHESTETANTLSDSLCWSSTCSPPEITSAK